MLTLFSSACVEMYTNQHYRNKKPEYIKKHEQDIAMKELFLRKKCDRPERETQPQS